MKNLLLALLLIAFTSSLAQTPVAKSVLDIENNDDFSTFGILNDSILNNYSLFFTGEDHRYLKSNAELELKMFKYLHKTAGVRIFMMEFGHSLGYVANKYVQTGDTAFYNILEKHTFDEYLELFNQLRSFYDSLPEDEKFSMVSVDLEREPVYPVKLLEYLLPEKGVAHDSIDIHIEAIKALSEFLDHEAEKNDKEEETIWDSEGADDSSYYKNRINIRYTVKLVIENYKNHKEIYRAYLGDNFTLFDEEITRIEDYFRYADFGENPLVGSYEYGGAAQEYIFREKYMEKNVLRVFAQNPGIKVFGQFGRCHTHRKREKEECAYYYFNSLATRLNTAETGPLKGRVFSMPVFYPAIWDFMDANVPINSGLQKMIDSTERNTVVMYLIDGGDSSMTSLGERFNAIIINYNEKDENSTEEEFPLTIAERDEDFRFVLAAEAGFSAYDFSKINQRYGTDFNSGPQFIGVTMDFINYPILGGISFRSYPRFEQQVNDSVSLTFSGYRVNEHFGFDVIRNKRIDLGLVFGYGYERWKMVTHEKFTDETRRDVFGNNRTTTYTNPAFVVNAALDLKVHISWVSLGVFAGYQFDFSKDIWRVNNKPTANSAPLSFTANSVGASLGINIAD